MTNIYRNSRVRFDMAGELGKGVWKENENKVQYKKMEKHDGQLCIVTSVDIEDKHGEALYASIMFDDGFELHTINEVHLFHESDVIV